MSPIRVILDILKLVLICRPNLSEGEGLIGVDFGFDLVALFLRSFDQLVDVVLGIYLSVSLSLPRHRAGKLLTVNLTILRILLFFEEGLRSEH